MILISASEFGRKPNKYLQIAISEKVGIKSRVGIFEIIPNQINNDNISPSNDPFWDDEQNVIEIRRRVDKLHTGKITSIKWSVAKKNLGL